ncbi:arginine N-succinyltransferase [Craterilacuibacter sp.]|uniref:arginine N-succinyltransferase n=1 Tax=Craterilacuibacter sp. TaxID=2870909 RepID=UPI003F39797D
MFVLRPAAVRDLPAIEELAAASPVGVTSLPANRETLLARILASEYSLAADVAFRGEERYFFVLEDCASGRLAGVCGVDAAAGFKEPFYSFRNETRVHAASELGIVNHIHVLSLCHDLSEHSLLTSFYLRPELAASAEAELLSRARLLFIANAPARFADTLVSAMLGVSCGDEGSPFWDSVGRVYFGLDYHEAEHLCGVRGRKFLAGLMPQQPVYVPLLSEAAQSVMGEVGADSDLPYDILSREGFESENYIDIFDGGPILLGRINALYSIAASRLFTLRIAGAQMAEGEASLIANTSLTGFRAVLAMARIEGDTLWLAASAAQALGVLDGDSVRMVPLQHAAEGGF